MRTISFGADHAGFALKRYLIDDMKKLGHEVVDHGTFDEQSCDYPDYAGRVCSDIIDNPDRIGVLVCGTGQGMAMAANKHAPIRAALCADELLAALARQHNNANVLVLGGLVTDRLHAANILSLFLDTPFEGDRHRRRIAKFSTL